MEVQKLLKQLVDATSSLGVARNELAIFGAERDILDQLDRVIGNARAFINSTTNYEGTVQ